MGARPVQKRCKRDHDDWRYDASKDSRYCHTCRLERNRSYRKTNPPNNRRRAARPEPKAPAWGMGADNKKMNSSRGSGLECTWNRTELLKARGYVV